MARCFGIVLFCGGSVAHSIELVQYPGGGLGTAFGGTGAPVSSTCRLCVVDGDANTAWLLSQSDSSGGSGLVRATASASFAHMTNVDSVTARAILTADGMGTSGLIKEAQFTILYLTAGGDVTPLYTESFGPLSGDSPSMISFNSTLANLDLRKVVSIRLEGEVTSTTNVGTAIRKVEFYHLEATGEFVPEPSSCVIALFGLVFAALSRRRTQAHGRRMGGSGSDNPSCRGEWHPESWRATIPNRRRGVG
jgi:hypothetical protein